MSFINIYSIFLSSLYAFAVVNRTVKVICCCRVQDVFVFCVGLPCMSNCCIAVMADL